MVRRKEKCKAKNSDQFSKENGKKIQTDENSYSNYEKSHNIGNVTNHEKITDNITKTLESTVS